MRATLRLARLFEGWMSAPGLLLHKKTFTNEAFESFQHVLDTFLDIASTMPMITPDMKPRPSYRRQVFSAGIFGNSRVHDSREVAESEVVFLGSLDCDHDDEAA